MPPKAQKPALHPDQLKDYFFAGCKPPTDLAVGVEWEKIGIYSQTGQAISYLGPRGVKAIFEGLVSKFGWQIADLSANEPIALKKGGTFITLEPGGQIELSGAKAKTIAENAAELFSHLAEIKKISQPLGIVWLGLGAQPFSVASEIDWVPKDRYRIMRQRLSQKGSQTYSMMKETASVQISIDYTSEKDAIQKLRLAMALSPFLTGLFANSPLERGRVSNFLSRRAEIWRHTAPERSGILWQIFQPDFSFQDYVDYALKVPLLFIQRESRWIQTDEISFKQFLESGWKNYEAEPADWELHLSSIFTEARLKNYLEIRGIDCQTPALGLSAVAFIKGIFYNENAKKSAWGLLKNLTFEERVKLFSEAPQKALKTKFKSGFMLATCQELVRISREGLTESERAYLVPIQTLLESGHCPAEKLLECIGKTSVPSEVLKAILRCCSV